MIHRCDKHTGRETIPALCETCQRMAVEQDIVTRTVDALIAAGYSVRESESEHGTRDETLDILFDLDIALLSVSKTDTTESPVSDLVDVGWIQFVFGNDGYDVISDYTTNLESVLAPINAYAETLEP